MQRSRLVIAFVVFLVIALAGAAYWYSRGAGTPPPTPGTTTGEALIGGPFSLVAQDGRRVTEGDLKGRFSVVYFGYTHCPDMCPLGLETVTRAMELLPQPAAERVQPVFVTVDPARDTPEVMRAYAASFHPRLLALSGSEAEVQGALKAYRVYARKAAEGTQAGGAEYLVDHSTFTYVMGPDGRYLAHFSHGTTAEDMAKRLGALLGEASATS
jgi:protein SCO1/2